MDLIRPLFETLVLRYPEGPTAIQALAIPSIMENGCDFVIRWVLRMLLSFKILF